MSATRTIAVALLLSAALGGCSGSTAPKPVKIDPRPEVYEPVYRVATELRSAQEVGMNRRRFGELLEKLATELFAGQGQGRILPRSSECSWGMRKSSRFTRMQRAVWDVKISVPEIKNLSDEAQKMEVAGRFVRFYHEEF